MSLRTSQKGGIISITTGKGEQLTFDATEADLEFSTQNGETFELLLDIYLFT
jgi:hypothetical protein